MYFHIFSKIYLVLIQKELDYKRKCTAKILVVMSNKQNQNFCKNAIKIVFVRSFEIGQRICINVQLISSIKIRIRDYMSSMNTRKVMLTCSLLDTMCHLSLLRNLFMFMLYYIDYKRYWSLQCKNILFCKISENAFLLVYTIITIMVLFLRCLWYSHSRPLHLWCNQYIAAKLHKHIWIMSNTFLCIIFDLKY